MDKLSIVTWIPRVFLCQELSSLWKLASWWPVVDPENTSDDGLFISPSTSFLSLLLAMKTRRKRPENLWVMSKYGMA